MYTDETILVVDDSSSYLVQLVSMLTKKGYRAISADSGELALTYVTQYEPDLLLLDVCMPGIDGLEVCRRLKAQEATRSLPVILISGLNTVQDWAEGLRAGAADYVTKPFQIDELLTRIRTQLALREATLSVERQATSLRQANEELRKGLAEAERAHQAMLESLEERKRVEEVLRASERLYRSLFENMLNALAYCRALNEPDKSPDFVFLAVNDAFVAQTGLRDVVGKKVSDVIPGICESDTAFVERLCRVANGGGPERFETLVSALNSWFAVSAYSPAPEHFVIVFDVITEHKRAEMALREFEERFATAFRCSPVSMAITATSTGRYVDANDMFLRNSGYRAEEIIGHTSAEVGLFHNPDDRDRLLAEVRRQGFAYCLEMPFRMKDGERRDGLISAQVIQLRGEPHLLASIVDITDRKRADDRLRESEEKYRCLFDSSYDAIVTLDPTSLRFVGANPAGIAMFGVTHLQELLEHAPTDLSPERQPDGLTSIEKAQAMTAEAMRKGTVSFEWNHKRIDGREFLTTVRLSRTEIGGKAILQGNIRDISKLRQVELQLEHARKLEAVGQLAAGIAHEINTPTQYVGDGVHFLEEAYRGQLRLLAQYRRAVDALSCVGGHEALLDEIRVTEEEIDLAYLDTNVPGSFASCKEGIARITTIVRAMKAFAHPDQKEMAAADLNQALQTTLAIARNEYKYVAEVTTDFGELPPVRCHLGDLNQVFLNLIVNAAHAIGEVVGRNVERGTILVRTLCEGQFVRIDIADTGSGIPESIRHRVFDPFFTTKPVGKGSGQGLAIARSIVVDKHGGALTFESEVGKGTTFTMLLPIEGKSASQQDG